MEIHPFHFHQTNCRAYRFLLTWSIANTSLYVLLNMRSPLILVAVIFFAFHAVWGALPNAATAGLIVWVDPDGDGGQTPDEEGAPEWMDLLANAGHTVVGQALSNSDGTLSAAEKVSLNAADLVILGPDDSLFGLNSPNSGPDWNSLTTPLIAMNSRVIDNHLGTWNWTSIPTAGSAGTGGMVADPTDSILDGIGESQVTTLTSRARLGSASLFFGGTKVVSTGGPGFTVIGRWHAENSGGNLAPVTGSSSPVPPIVILCPPTSLRRQARHSL